MTYRLGVDLGTTFTAAAVSNGTPPTMLGLGNRALQIPSVLFISGDGELLVGESAERRGRSEPDRVVREFKRRIGDSVPLLVGGSLYSPQSLTAKLLRHVVDVATERQGSPPAEVVLTHPANWGRFKLDLLDQAASLADVGPAVFCPEPVAAAAQYAAQTRVEVGETFAVYDLGGGTFDACVLRKTETGFAVLGSPKGIEHLGGMDLDKALLQYVLGLLEDRISGLDPDDADTQFGLGRLRRDCVEAKEALSSETDTVIGVTLPGVSTRVRLNRGELETLIRPALEDTVQAMTRALRSAEVDAGDLAAIVLIGGSSRIPLVSELLQETFATATALDTHPKHDVALGSVRRSGPVPASPPRPPAPPPEARVATPPVERSEPAPAASVPADPVAADPVPTTRTPPAGRPASRPTRRRLLVGAGVAVVVAGVVTGVAVANRGTAEVPPISGTSLAPAPTAAPSASESADGLPVGPALTANQLIVPVLIDDNWDLWLADTTQPAPALRLTTDGAPDTTPAVSPDGRTVVYTHDLQGTGRRVLLVKAASVPGDGRPLFATVPAPCAGNVFRPAWNPVRPAELVLPCIDAGGRYGLYRITTAGQVLGSVPLPKGTGRLDDPSYSPDGRSLVFWAAPPSTWDGGTLYTVALPGGKPKQLLPTTRPGEDADPVWAPDGRHIAFRRRVPDGTTAGNFDLYRVTTDGSAELERLTDDPADEQDPTYAPDGRQLAYKSSAQDPAHPENLIARTWVLDVGRDRARVLWSEGADDPQTAPGWGRR